MGSIKDRNGMDLTEAEDMKKRWQEYRGTVPKKIFTTQIIMILECEVKWALEITTNKAKEVIEFQLSYFKS